MAATVVVQPVSPEPFKVYALIQSCHYLHDGNEFSHDALESTQFEQELISRYVSWLESTLLHRMCFAAENPMSPVHNTIVRNGNPNPRSTSSALSVIFLIHRMNLLVSRISPFLLY